MGAMNMLVDTGPNHHVTATAIIKGTGAIAAAAMYGMAAVGVMASGMNQQTTGLGIGEETIMKAEIMAVEIMKVAIADMTNIGTKYSSRSIIIKGVFERALFLISTTGR